jgi:hypothetical protein
MGTPRDDSISMVNSLPVKEYIGNRRKGGEKMEVDQRVAMPSGEA